MTWQAELQPDRFAAPGCGLLAVGWLMRDQPYPRGPVSQDFFDRLAQFCRSPWHPPMVAVTAGFHSCELCQFDGPRLRGEIYLPHAGQVYVAPTGILHYVATHWYLPPPVFVDAVLACPPMHSMDYKKALLANGGRPLVAAQQR